MNWPKPEGRVKIPVGHYVFRLNKEPELKSWNYSNDKGEVKQGRKIMVYAIGLNDNGEFPMFDAIPVWDPRYEDLCSALGVEHGKDIQMAGAQFQADIIHEPDKNDPTKSWPRLINIKSADDVPTEKPFPDAEDDIPFN
jgi:hypothetical protein